MSGQVMLYLHWAMNILLEKEASSFFLPHLLHHGKSIESVGASFVYLKDMEKVRPFKGDMNGGAIYVSLFFILRMYI